MAQPVSFKALASNLLTQGERSLAQTILLEVESFAKAKCTYN